MLVERVSVEGKAVPLRVESGGESNPVAALRSIDFNQSNRYVKLRPEADQQLIETGTGKLYLGFRQDPVLGASWNNLASPPEYKIVAEGATVSPATGHSKRLEVESDNEPREFLVDVKDWDADKPISVKIQYFACNKEKGWCKSVQQEFTVWLDEDESAGMVNGRSHFPGGRQAPTGWSRWPDVGLAVGSDLSVDSGLGREIRDGRSFAVGRSIAPTLGFPPPSDGSYVQTLQLYADLSRASLT